MSGTDSGTKFVFYHYEPSLAAAIIFVIVFTLGAAVHIYLAQRLRARYFVAFIIGCIFELVGYIGRALSSKDKENLTYYIMQSLLLLVAPALFAATIYMILGRLTRSLGAEHHSLIPLKWLTKAFVIGDVVSFLIQSGGAGMMAQGKATSFSTGKNIVIVGLIVQILIFGFFMVVALVFNLRLHRQPTVLSAAQPWQKHMNVLFGTSIVILLRNLVRVVEYAQGNNGYIISHEYFLYIFDACFITAVVFVFAAIHPGSLIGSGKQRLDESRSDIETVVMEHGARKNQRH